MVRNQNSIHDNVFIRVASQMMQLKERYVSRLAILEGRATSQPGIVNGSVQVNNTMLHGEPALSTRRPRRPQVIAWPAQESKPGTPAYQARLFGRRVEGAVESSSKD